MWNKQNSGEEQSIVDSTSFFAKGVTLEGNINANNDIRIEGTIEGNIKTGKKVIVGTTGSIIGNVNAANIHLMGEVSGDIFISDLARIGETARINGTITADKLQIDPGAIIEAAIKRFSTSPNMVAQDHAEGKDTAKIENNSEGFRMSMAL